MKPQSIKISSCATRSIKKVKKLCPYELLWKYFKLRGPYASDTEPFFIFADQSPVSPPQFHTCLKNMLHLAGFDQALYSGHSLRMGRACDLLKLGVSVETIKDIGRWRSNTVFRYLKC